MNLPKKKTKIVCTIGPASWNQEVLEEMIKAGMNIARINLAHGDFDGHRRSINNVRTAAKTIGQRVTIFADLPGPKMRIGKLAHEEIILERGQTFILQTQEKIGDHTRVSMDFEGLPRVVKPGDNISWRERSMKTELYQTVTQDIDTKVTPSWLSVDKMDLSAQVMTLPTPEEIAAKFDGKMIVEYYSR